MPDDPSLAAQKAGFDLSLIEANLALSLEDRVRRHQAALDLVLELEKAKTKRDDALRNSSAKIDGRRR
jgi:hypothetical protein